MHHAAIVDVHSTAHAQEELRFHCPSKFFSARQSYYSRLSISLLSYDSRLTIPTESQIFLSQIYHVRRMRV